MGRTSSCGTSFKTACLLRFLLILLISACAYPAAGAAQAWQQLTDAARISIITVLPGDEIHALFGHTAIRVHDPQTGLDLVYNYGTFDFSDPMFVPRFVHGRMDYFLSVHGFEQAVVHYRDRERRPVIVQELDLSIEEVEAIFEFLRINAMPENRVYRYDFFFDNCSTRPRDVVEVALGKDLRYGEPLRGEQTFRELLAPYLERQPFLRAGINLLLGSPADRAATTRESMFLPLDLFARIETATVLRDGAAQPLVARTDTVAWVDGYDMSRRAPPWATNLTLLLLGAGVFFAIREVRTRRAVPTVLDATLLAFTGLIGFLILYMWFISEHTVTGPNVNLFWAWPTHLAAAYLIQRGRADRFVQSYLAAAAVVTSVLAAFWFIWPQSLPLAFLPLVVLIAVRCGVLWMRYRRRRVEIAA